MDKYDTTVVRQIVVAETAMLSAAPRLRREPVRDSLANGGGVAVRLKITVGVKVEGGWKTGVGIVVVATVDVTSTTRLLVDSEET